MKLKLNLNLNSQVSLDNVLKYAMYAILVFYSILGVRMLNKTHLENFSNIYLRLAIILLLVLSATWDPIVCLLMAIAFLMTHQRLQELKKEITNNSVNKLQESSNNKLDKMKKKNAELKANNKHLNIIVNEKLKNINEPFVIENTSELKDKTQEEVDTKFNYMSKNQVYNAVDDFFDMEKSFEKISGNLLPHA
jgi:hypothetical protein